MIMEKSWIFDCLSVFFCEKSLTVI